MDVTRLPVSARQAGEVLAGWESGGAPRFLPASSEEAPAVGMILAGEWERRELVRGIAERMAALDPDEFSLCLRLLRHLEQPAPAGALTVG